MQKKLKTSPVFNCITLIYNTIAPLMGFTTDSLWAHRDVLNNKVRDFALGNPYETPQ